MIKKKIEIPMKMALEPPMGLRHDDRTGRHISVGSPRAVATGLGTLLLAVDHPDGTRSLLGRSAGRLMVARVAGDETEPVAATRIGLLDSDIDCAADLGDGLVVMMTASGKALFAAYDDATAQWSFPGELPLLEAPSLTSMTLATVSVDLPQRSLAGSYGQGDTRLSAADLERLSADYATAYQALADMARSEGGAMQPLLARVTLYDRRGRMIYRGAPTLLTPDDAPLNCSALERGVTVADTKAVVASSTLAARLFRLKVTWPRIDADIWDAWVGRVEIETGAVIEPFDAKATSAYRLTNPVSGSASLRQTLPGLGLSGFSEAYLRRIADTLDADEWATAAVLLPDVREGWTSVPQTTVVVPAPAEAPRTCRGLPADLHSFTARRTTGCADTRLWADTTRRLFAGWSPRELGGSFAAGDWSGWTRVEMADTTADGRPVSVVRTDRADRLRPVTVGPLIAYPDARATRLTIGVDGRWATVGLSPSPSGRYAYYISPTLTPLALVDADEATVVPAENPVAERRPGEVALALAAAPLTLRASVTLSGRVKALAPAVRAGSALDYGVMRFHALGDHGIDMLTADRSRSLLQASPLTATATSTDLWAMTPEGIVVATGNRLKRLSGTRLTDLGILPTTPTLMAYDPQRDEVRLVDDSGRFVVRERDGAWYVSPFAAESLLQLPDRLLAGAPEVAVELGSEADDGPALPIDVVLRRCIDARLWTIVWDFTATDAALTLTVTADGGDAATARRVASLAVRGAVTRPVVQRFLGPAVGWLTLQVSGTARGMAMGGAIVNPS